jgi:hypothetical protein
MNRLFLVLLVPFSIFSQQLVNSFSVDTSQYDKTDIVVCQSPYNSYSFIGVSLIAFRQKGSNQVDIYSYFSGKIASVNVPFSTLPAKSYMPFLYISQTILDADSGWESIVDYFDSTGYDNGVPMSPRFKVFDDNGTQLISDNGLAAYGFDNQNTYVYTTYPNAKIWKFRTGISAAAPLLQKRAVDAGPVMSFTPTGNLRVIMQPTGNGQTSIQLLDMLGRTIFSRMISNSGTTESFTIPAANVPNTPFVSKIKNESGVYLKETVPVK